LTEILEIPVIISSESQSQNFLGNCSLSPLPHLPDIYYCEIQPGADLAIYLYMLPAALLAERSGVCDQIIPKAPLSLYLAEPFNLTPENAYTVYQSRYETPVFFVSAAVPGQRDADAAVPASDEQGLLRATFDPASEDRIRDTINFVLKRLMQLMQPT
jgi:hypothetical protein